MSAWLDVIRMRIEIDFELVRIIRRALRAPMPVPASARRAVDERVVLSESRMGAICTSGSAWRQRAASEFSRNTGRPRHTVATSLHVEATGGTGSGAEAERHPSRGFTLS
jgi:hypothetical protein